MLTQATEIFLFNLFFFRSLSHTNHIQHITEIILFSTLIFSNGISAQLLRYISHVMSKMNPNQFNVEFSGKSSVW